MQHSFNKNQLIRIRAVLLGSGKKDRIRIRRCVYLLTFQIESVFWTKNNYNILVMNIIFRMMLLQIQAFRKVGSGSFCEKG